MEFTAKARYVRVSPQKARLVLGLIKGKRVEEALNTLAFTKKGIAPAIYKLLRSAYDNANHLVNEKSLDVDTDRLIVLRAIANDGPRMKRIRPAPMGRAYRYQRRISHIEIAVGEKSAVVTAKATGESPAAPAKKPARKAPAKKTAAKKTAAKKTAKKK